MKRWAVRECACAVELFVKTGSENCNKDFDESLINGKLLLPMHFVVR